MSPISKRWIVAPETTPAGRHALADFDPILAQILFNRGLADPALARAFLDGEYTRPDDPLLMIGVPAAVDRLRRAIRAGEKIAVYGDYDTDGVTATALLVTALDSVGANVRPKIPNRFDEGYGLNNEALSGLKDEGVAVVVSVDCGIRSLDEADHARRIGLDLIISDHHHVGEELPRALAVINPKQAGDEYPEEGLAGVGLAYKIAQALLRAENRGVAEESLLDLVALGTVADLAPLTGENRVLVRRGLKTLNQAKREGLKSLIALSRAKPGQIDATTIGFTLGPRLNAAGRLESALAAYELLMTADTFKASQFAQQLEQQNRERQRLTVETQKQAREIVLAKEPDAPFLFAAHRDFSPGIVGLAAARLTEEFYRPSAVAQIG
ncbi:MAG: DHH family phosphoesterase, partial [Chloroflexi bacterium]|nr:DHH family phosphoesterase [Chloroflexota bacterium]